MEDERIGFKNQLFYKEEIDKRGLKYRFVADKIGIHKVTLSLFINGKMYMPPAVKEKLNKFLEL